MSLALRTAAVAIYLSFCLTPAPAQSFPSNYRDFGILHPDQNDSPQATSKKMPVEVQSYAGDLNQVVGDGDQARVRVWAFYDHPTTGRRTVELDSTETAIFKTVDGRFVGEPEGTSPGTINYQGQNQQIYWMQHPHQAQVVFYNPYKDKIESNFGYGFGLSF